MRLNEINTNNKHEYYELGLAQKLNRCHFLTESLLEFEITSKSS